MGEDVRHSVVEPSKIDLALHKTVAGGQKYFGLVEYLHFKLTVMLTVIAERTLTPWALFIARGQIKTPDSGAIACLSGCLSSGQALSQN